MNLAIKSLNTEAITFSTKQIINNCIYFTIMYKKEPFTLQIPNIKYNSYVYDEASKMYILNFYLSKNNTKSTNILESINKSVISFITCNKSKI